MASSNISTYTSLLFSSLFFFHLLISSANSTHFNFSSSSNPNNKGIIYYGAAISDSSGFFDLTSTNVSRGRAIYNQSILLWNPITRQLADFTTHFDFRIIRTEEYGVGDGMVFFLSPNGSFIPDDLVRLNRTNNSTPPFVGVEFDTYPNKYWDPNDTLNHISIDFNKPVRSVVSNGTTYLFNSSSVLEASVVYNGTQRRLSVNLTFGINGTDSAALTLSHDVDFRVVFDSPYVHIGFSATTGISEFHQIDSWTFDCTDFHQTKFHFRKVRVIAGVVVVSLVTVVLGLLLMWLVRKMKSRRRNRDDDDDDIDLGDNERGPQKFPYGKLAAATDDFNDERKLGAGGFGGVYRGFLKDMGLEVAIKKVSDASKQGKKEYLSEVQIISQLRHRHLVQLIGYCRSNSRFLLVYELIPNGSLDSHLFGPKPPLSWPDRHKIALGLASALLYLHEEWTQCVLHRDVKASNVMLDENFEAKLGDFGLARLVEHDQNLQTTDVAGTRGYLAPECYYTGKASKESDVYRFGVVALEIACGRKVIDFTAGEERLILVKWVWELYGLGRLSEAVDERLGGEFDEGEIERLMVVGLWCAHPNHASRPSMRQAIGVLHSEAELPELPCNMHLPFVAQPPIDQIVISYASYSNSPVSAR